MLIMEVKALHFVLIVYPSFLNNLPSPPPSYQYKKGLVWRGGVGKEGHSRCLKEAFKLICAHTKAMPCRITHQVEEANLVNRYPSLAQH